MRHALLVSTLLVMPGCLGGSAGQPDQVVIENQRPTPVEGNLTIRSPAGEPVFAAHFRLEPGEEEEHEVGQLNGRHNVMIEIDGTVGGEELSLEPIKEYIQVMVRPDTIEVITLHGD